MSGIGTKCVQAGYTPGSGEPRQVPIIQSTTFKYASSSDMGKLFDLEASGYFYSRLQNPTNDTVAAKIAALEGGSAAMLTSSGQAANFYAVFNIASCGDHVVSSSSIYGGSYNLFAVTMKRMGVDYHMYKDTAESKRMLAEYEAGKTGADTTEDSESNETESTDDTTDTTTEADASDASADNDDTATENCENENEKE